jgi:DNA-3-methyladenine glycosylase
VGRRSSAEVGFPRAVLAGATLDAARALLGARLVRPPDRVGRIVEVEAYVGPEDQASHARMGRTPRNAVMFGPPGIAYVYLVYGMHHCLNVVTELEPRPAAILIRAVEPEQGIGVMRAARARSRARRRARGAVPQGPGAGSGIAVHRLAAGPGLVCAAFDIDRTFDGLDLCDRDARLHLAPRPADEPEPEIVATPRIGVGYAAEPWASMPWRLLVADSPSVSGARRRG